MFICSASATQHPPSVPASPTCSRTTADRHTAPDTATPARHPRRGVAPPAVQVAISLFLSCFRTVQRASARDVAPHAQSSRAICSLRSDPIYPARPAPHTTAVVETSRAGCCRVVRQPPLCSVSVSSNLRFLHTVRRRARVSHVASQRHLDEAHAAWRSPGNALATHPATAAAGAVLRDPPLVIFFGRRLRAHVAAQRAHTISAYFGLCQCFLRLDAARRQHQRKFQETPAPLAP
mmetsp:Transcript_26664/g.82506  ORF Transcript_26664/g.82506 Transcript_26664/m.82506 type:complete len:235 (-) Transcript_26664:716-1420(-)